MNDPSPSNARCALRVAIHMKGVFFTVQKAIPLMSKGSAIVLNASINAHLGMPGTTVYGATRAVINMAKTLSNLASTILKSRKFRGRGKKLKSSCTRYVPVGRTF